MSSDNDIDIVDIYPTAPVLSGATLTFAYPAGRSANSYTRENATLLVRATNTVFSDIAVTYGASSMTVVYTGATIPAATKVSLQVEALAAEADVEITGDGSTDDTTAIQAAIDALPATGGEIVLGAGIFMVSGIRLDGTSGDKSNVTLRGQGRGTTIRKMANSALTTAAQKRSNVIFALTGGGFVVRDLNVEGNYSRGGSAQRPTFTTKHTLGSVFGAAGTVLSVSSTGTAGTNNPTDKVYLVTVSGAGQTSSGSNISVDVGLGYVTDVSSQVWDEVTATGYYNYYQCDDDFAYRHGIYMNGTSAAIADCVVDNVHVTDCVYGGILIGSGPLIGGMTYSGSLRSRISNCYVYANNGSNIGGGYKVHQTISNCTVYGGNSSGIRMDEGSNYSTVTGCTVNGNDTQINGGINCYKSDYCTITGNVVRNASPGIWMQEADNFSVSGNTVMSSAGVGISIASTNNGGSCTGNMVTENTSHGIQVSIGKVTSVVGNMCFSNGGSGIRLSGGSSSCTVTANVCNDNSTAGGTTNAGIIVTDSTNSVIAANKCSDSAGGSGTQTVGINETGSSSNNTFFGNAVFGNKTTAKTILSASHDILNPAGSATDVDLLIDARGAGLLSLGSYTAGAATDSTGYITIKDAGGTSRKVMVQA